MPRVLPEHDGAGATAPAKHDRRAGLERHRHDPRRLPGLATQLVTECGDAQLRGTVRFDPVAPPRPMARTVGSNVHGLTARRSGSYQSLSIRPCVAGYVPVPMLACPAHVFVMPSGTVARGNTAPAVRRRCKPAVHWLPVPNRRNRP